MPVIALERQLLAVAHAAMDAHCIERALLCDLGGIELGNPGIEVAAYAGVLLARRIEREQPRGADLHDHLRQPQLLSLVLEDGLAEGLTLLCVADGVVECGLGHAHSPSGNIYPADFERAHDVLEPAAFAAAQYLGRWHAAVIKGQFSRLDSLVAQLFQPSSGSETGRARIHQERRDATVPGVRRWVSLGHREVHARPMAVGHPHLLPV